MVDFADQDLAAGHLPLEMTFQAQVGIAFRQHLGVDAAVRAVAGSAAFPDGFVLKNEDSLLRFMAMGAVFLLRKQLRAAAGMGYSLMRRMTLNARHPAFRHGMMIRQIELTPDIQMALITDRLDRPGVLQRQTRPLPHRLGSSRGEAKGRFDVAARIGMQTTGAVTGFATGAQGIFPLGNQPGVIRGFEIAADFLVTLFAFARPDVFRARHIRQRHGSPADAAARNHGQQNEPDADGAYKSAGMAALGPKLLEVGYGFQAVILMVNFVVDQIFRRIQQVDGGDWVVNSSAAIVQNQVQVKAGFFDVVGNQRLARGVGAAETHLIQLLPARNQTG